MADQLEDIAVDQEDPQVPPLPKGYEPIKKNGTIPPLPAGYEPLKKKEGGALPSTGQLKSPDQAILDYVSKVQSKNITPEQQDHAKVLTQIPIEKLRNQPLLAEPTEEKVLTDAHKKLFDIAYGEGNKWKDPLKAIQEEQSQNPKNLVTNVATQELATNSIAPDGYEANKLLALSRWGKEGSDNVTANFIKDKAKKYNDVVDGLRNVTDFDQKASVRDAAVLAFAKTNPQFAKELQAAGISLDDPMLADKIPSGKMGQITEAFVNDPNVSSYLKKENPNLAPIVEDIAKNNLKDNPDYAINQVANEVSQARTKLGLNAAIINFYGKDAEEATNKVAEELYKDNPEKLAIYNSTIRNNQGDYIDAPSLLSRVASGIKGGFAGVGNTLMQPFTSEKKSVLDKWEKDASHVSADPQGFLKFTSDAGNVLGFIMSLEATAGTTGMGSLNALTAATTGDIIQEAREKYRGEPVKAAASATMNALLYRALGKDIFPGEKAKAAFEEVKPEMDKIAESLTNGAITKEAARREAQSVYAKAIDFATGTLTKNTKIAGELTGITLLNRGLDKVMMDKQTFQENHPDSEIPDSFEHNFLSNIVLAGLGKYGEMKNANNVVAESLYNAASNPKQAARLIDNESTKASFGDANEMKDNLDYISKLKQSLDIQGVDEKNQKRFIFEALQEKAKRELNQPTGNEAIDRKQEEDLKVHQDVQEKILNGEDVQKKEKTEPTWQSQLDEAAAKEKPLPEDLLSKEAEKAPEEKIVNDSIEAAKDIPSEGWRNAFLENPKESLRQIAQQVHSSESEKSGAINTFTKKITDLATELYPTKESTLEKQQPEKALTEEEIKAPSEQQPKEGFTEGQDLNRIYSDLKEKYGDKKAATLYETANRLVNPNKNEIIEIRGNGVVVKEGDKYILKPFGNTDTNSKKWTLYKGLDITDQFSKKQPKTVTNETIPSTTEVPEQIPPSEKTPAEEPTIEAGRTAKEDFTAKGGNKVVDEKGEPLTVYHGTNKEFEKLDLSKPQRGLFFTKDKETASSYANAAGKKGRVIEANINIQNPHIIDAKGKSYDEIMVDLDKVDMATGKGASKKMTTDEIVEALRGMRSEKIVTNLYGTKTKADGIIIKNVKDKLSNQGELTDIYIPFKNEQVIEKQPTIEAGKGAEPPTEEPPKPETGSVEEELPQRRFTKQMLRSDELSEATKDEVMKTLNYTRQTNEMSLKEANDVIDRVGLDEAQNHVMNDGELKPVVRVVLGQTLIKKYNELSEKADNEPEKYYYLDKAIQTANFVTEKLATEAGQQIQAFSMWSILSPEGQLRAANQDMARQGKEKLARREKDINVIGEKFQKANKEAADELTKSENVKKAVEKTESSRVKKAKDKIETAKKKRENIIKKYKGDKGKNLYAGVGLTKEGIEFVGDLVKTYVEEGVAKLEIVVDKVLQHLKDVSGKVPNDEVKKNVTDLVKEHIEKKENVRIAEGLSGLEKEINKIVREHYTIPEEAKKTLIDKFIEKAGLEKPDAEQLAKEIETEFDKIATRKKRNILYNEKARFDKINKTLESGKKTEPKTVQSDLIKYSNLGAFETSEFKDMVAEKFGIGELTPEQAAKLMELAKKVQKAPEGTPKKDATEDLLAYRANLRGNNLMETAQAVWYANVLSGYKTHLKNIVSTFLNSMGELGAEMAKDPKAIPYILGGYIKGVTKRGFVEAAHTVITGRSPIHIKKIETPNTLERRNFVGGGWNPANWFKYVTRLMVAEDVLSFQGLKEARAYQLARREASKLGVDTWSKKGWDKVNEILLHTKERWNEAETQATQEGLKPNSLEHKRRIYELMEDSRPVKMTEDAYGFAAHGTFNHESEGTLGAITNAVAGALDSVSVGGFKPLRLIVPFTRIITNVVNNSLDFSPVGLIRGIRGVRGFESFEHNQFTKGAYKKLTNEERQRLIAKAAIGITLAATFQALHQAGVIQVSGGGTGDPKKDAQLRQSGWQEYSIKVGNTWISYKYSPLVFMMGFLGNMNDAEKYGEKESDKTFGKRMEVAASRLGGQVSDMTWINSASTFLGSLAEKNTDAAVKGINQTLANTAKGFIPFSSAINQTSQEMQSIFSMPQKQVNNAWQALIQDVPIARNTLNDKINALGDPIVRDVDVITSEETKDKVWKYLLDKQGWVAPVNRGTLIIYDPETKSDRPVNDDEYFQYSKLRGQMIKREIEKIIDNGATITEEKRKIKKSADELSTGQLNILLGNIERKATVEAKDELFAPREKKRLKISVNK